MYMYFSTVTPCAPEGDRTVDKTLILRLRKNVMPNFPNIVDFRRFDSSEMLFFRGGIPRPIGDFPESLNQAMLVGTMLVGRLGVRLKPKYPYRQLKS